MAETPPPSVPLPVTLALVLLSLVVLAYSLVVVQQVLLGVLLVVLLGNVYVLWRFFVAFEAIADAHQRIAREMEAE